MHMHMCVHMYVYIYMYKWKSAYSFFRLSSELIFVFYLDNQLERRNIYYYMYYNILGEYIRWMLGEYCILGE